MVVPLTATVRNPFPSEFVIDPSSANGLTNQSRFLGSQIITIDKRYLGKRIGALESKYHPSIEEALKVVLGWRGK